ncbi:hypothetical protein [Roseimaritima ulvae]|uniref:hypothetical protein n=1 Tax=Roseimaritima ulvae TaxID=980254 RepID=UPI000832A941|nr:hypothetical protein [Roseimaritima ulvae]
MNHNHNHSDNADPQHPSLPARWRRAPSGTAAVLALSFVGSAAYAITHALALTLFLSRLTTEQLPYALAVAALLAAAVARGCNRLVRRYSPRFALRGSYLALCGGSLVLTILVAFAGAVPAVLVALFVLAELRGTVNSVHTTIWSNEAFAAGRSHQPYVWVSTAATLAGVLTGALLTFSAQYLGAVSILALATALDLVVLLMIAQRLPQTAAVSSRCEATAKQPAGGPLEPVRSPLSVASALAATTHERQYRRVRHYRWALGMVLVSEVIALTFIGYQWKAITGDFLANDEASLLGFVAAFGAALDGCVLIVQWTAAGRSLDRFGIGWVLLLYPLLLLLAGFGMLAAPTTAALYIAISVARGMNVLRRSIYAPALASAYAIFRPDIRRRAIVVNQGALKPLAEAGSALALIWFVPQAEVLMLTLIWILVVTPWLFMALLVVCIHQSGRPDVMVAPQLANQRYREAPG